MRRFLTATFTGLLWTAIFGLSLFAQTGTERLSSSPSFTIPPFVPPAGATITVTTGLDNLSDNGDCTLREAIQAANTDTAVDACPAGNGADLILLAAGSYGLSLEGRSEDENATGDLDIFSSLVISGGGSAATIIDANQTDRVLHILTGTVEIRGVTVRNGRAADGADTGCGGDGWDAGCPGESGGGIVNLGSTILIDVVAQNNRSGDGGKADDSDWAGGDGGDGGGIINNGNLEIYQSQIVENIAGDGIAWGAGGGEGGGIHNRGVLFGDRFVVARNRAGYAGPVPKGSGGGGWGGGIVNQGMITITNGQIISNTTAQYSGGGGVYNAGDIWLITNDIGHNTGGEIGGGGILNQGKLVMERSTISDNWVRRGGDGGGLLNVGASSLINSTVSGNQSGAPYVYYYGHFGGDGGGIFNGGNLVLQNTTLAYNQTRNMVCFDLSDCPSTMGGSGGGLANEDGAVTIHNSLIAQNGVSDGGVGPDCFGIVTSQGTNLIGSSDGCTLAGAADDILEQYAWLGPLLDNGGPTLTHALLPYSLALDAGSCTTLDGAPLLTDQRGEPRPQGADCDLGAFESPLSTLPLPERLHLPIIRMQPN